LGSLSNRSGDVGAIVSRNRGQIHLVDPCPVLQLHGWLRSQFSRFLLVQPECHRLRLALMGRVAHENPYKHDTSYSTQQNLWTYRQCARGVIFEDLKVDPSEWSGAQQFAEVVPTRCLLIESLRPASSSGGVFSHKNRQTLFTAGLFFMAGLFFTAGLFSFRRVIFAPSVLSRPDSF
jgi:hypothetical protein